MATVYELNRKQWVPRPIGEVFEFFSDAYNLELITPPWVGFEIYTPQPIPMRAGTVIDYTLKVRGLPIRWRTKITVWEPPHHFEDIQVRGPYALWDHTHWFEESDGGTLMRDHVRYALPFGPLGRVAHALIVARDLENIFNYRYDVIRERFGGPERSL